MHLFCPKCDSVLAPLKNKKDTTNSQILKCMDCEYKSTTKEDGFDDYVIKGSIKHTSKSKIEVVDREEKDISISSDIREELREQYREALGNSN